VTLPSVFATAAVIVLRAVRRLATDIPIHMCFHVIVTVQPCLLCRSATRVFTAVPKRITEEGNKFEYSEIYREM